MFTRQDNRAKQKYNAEQKDYIERKIKEFHEYILNIVQLYITWYSFFMTVNFASMGWLATSYVQNKGGMLIYSVCGLFVIQNVLSMYSCYCVYKTLSDYNARVSELERLSNFALESMQKESMRTSIPIHLYKRISQLMGISLFLLIVAWSAYAFSLPYRPIS
jgi:membrane-anchored glycerophosphoryl diester phosphodiesterase (GDPDase)